MGTACLQEVWAQRCPMPHFQNHEQPSGNDIHSSYKGITLFHSANKRQFIWIPCRCSSAVNTTQKEHAVSSEASLQRAVWCRSIMWDSVISHMSLFVIWSVRPTMTPTTVTARENGQHMLCLLFRFKVSKVDVNWLMLSCGKQSLTRHSSDCWNVASQQTERSFVIFPLLTCGVTWGCCICAEQAPLVVKCHMEQDFKTSIHQHN